MAGLLGAKVGMTQVYDAAGAEVPVTVVKAGPCAVLQVRTLDKDGYEAVQLGFGAKPRRLCSQSESGRVAGVLPGLVEKSVLTSGDGGFRFVREFRLGASDSRPAAGDVLSVGMFAEIAHVDVTGVSKGRGFAGVMKRHNFAGGPASHGSGFHRHGGSTGMRSTPGRCLPGQKKSGRMGNEMVTTQNLRVVKVDLEKNVILVEGAVPGPRNGLVYISKAKKKA